MREYVGIKRVKAMPQTFDKYCTEAPGADPSKVTGERREGYQVVYPGGYVSWCPREEFEAAYQGLEERMDFSRALWLMQQGHKVFRREHIKQGILQYVAIAFPDEAGMGVDPNTEPYLYRATGAPGNFRRPTSLDDDDILADDWLVVG